MRVFFKNRCSLRIFGAPRFSDLPDGMVYSEFIGWLKMSGIEVDRKILAELAVNNAESFGHIVEQAKKALTA